MMSPKESPGAPAASEAERAVLFVGPDPDKGGGIATFCRSVFPEIRFPAAYFARGTSSGPSRVGARLVKPVGDLRAFTRVLRDERYRVVHLNLSLSRVSVLRDRGFVAAAKRADRAVVLGVHGWNQRFFDAAMRSRLGGVRRFLSAADRIFVVNRDARDSLRSSGYGDAVEVVASALETSLVAGVRREDLEASRHGPPRLLFLARLEASKGILETIRAFESVKRRYPEAELLIAGEGGAAPEAAEYVRRRAIEGVRFLGHVTGDQKRDVLRHATLYVLPSSHDEGMPHSVIEAMAFGLPVVTRPVAGVRDFFVDREMGSVCGEDADSLSGAIIALLDDPAARVRIGRRNFAFAREVFAADKLAARFDATYRRLAPDGRSPGSHHHREHPG